MSEVKGCKHGCKEYTIGAACAWDTTGIPVLLVMAC